MSDLDEYPSARAALFDSDKLVNFRCFLKYILWHGAYLLLGLVGVVLFAGAKILDKLSRSGGNRAAGAVGRGLQNSKVRKASRYAWGAFMVAYVAVGVAWIGYLFVQLLLANPVMTIAATVGAIVAIVALLAGWAYGGPYIKSALYRGGSAVAGAASTAGSKAVETPGIRRVYGECPVSMDMEPKWFDKLFGE